MDHVLAGQHKHPLRKILIRRMSRYFAESLLLSQPSRTPAYCAALCGIARDCADDDQETVPAP